MSDTPESNQNNSEGEQTTPEPSNSVEPTAEANNAFNFGTVIEDAKKVITDPVGFYKSMPTTGGYANPVIFVIVMTLATAVIGFLLSAIGIVKFNAIVGGAVTIGMVIIIPIFAVLGSFIAAAIMFVIWKLMGSEKDYETAYRCIAYSSAIAPVIAVISLIPYLANLIKALWGGFLIYTASTEVHKIKNQTAMIVIGILTALNVFISFGSERTARHWQGKMKGFEKATEQFERSAKDGSIGAALQNMESMEDMTPEEAGKQVGEFLKGLEKFGEGLEESVKEAEED